MTMQNSWSSLRSLQPTLANVNPHQLSRRKKTAADSLILPLFSHEKCLGYEGWNGFC